MARRLGFAWRAGAPVFIAWLAAAALSHADGHARESPTTCAFDPASRVLSVRLGSDLSPTLARDHDAITVTSGFDLTPTRCAGGQATVTNTDSIAVKSPRAFGELWVDVRSGLLAPGASPEDDGSPEIEISAHLSRNQLLAFFLWGSRRSDVFRAGALGKGIGINLNAGADHDADVMLDPGASALIDGGTGDDQISSSGGQGFTGPLGGLVGGAILEGGLGNDRLTGSQLSEAFYGGGGHDVIRALGGSDAIYASDGQRDQIQCGSGHDKARIDGHDRLRACERTSSSRKTSAAEVHRAKARGSRYARDRARRKHDVPLRMGSDTSSGV